ncbi:hypothetical protein G7046_g8375 [Stylonectria norvegica]|nr:hypothetical protein G7046_g8375 [Stylonectria norvegica]
MGNHKVAIIGAGPAGCLLARLLHLGGTDVSVFEGETSPDFRSQGGTLDLHTATGLAALQEADLFDEFLKHARYDGQYMAITDKDLHYHLVRNADGKSTKIEERPEIDRAKLRELLARSLPVGIIKWGRRLQKIEDGKLVFADSSTVGGFDLIVGADGAWSKVRKDLAPDLEPVYTGIALNELEIPAAEKTAPEVYKLVNRGSIFACCDGQRLSIQQMGDGSLSMYASFVDESPDWMKPEKCGYDANNLEETIPRLLEERYSDWSPQLREALEHAQGKCIPRSLYALPVGAKWTHRPGLTLIGDAAHLMTPYAGEGVNQALEDAMLLARAINGAGDDEAALDKAVRHFEEAMFVRVSKVQELAQGLLQDWMFTPGAPGSVMAKAMSRHVNHRLPVVLHLPPSDTFPRCAGPYVAGSTPKPASYPPGTPPPEPFNTIKSPTPWARLAAQLLDPATIMDSSQAPLIPDRSGDDELEYDADDAAPDDARKITDGKPSTFVLLLTFAAGISGLLFGYDTGVVSATLVSLGTSLSNRELTSLDKSIITSSTSLFALLVSPFSSILADKLGRKRVILYADLLFVLGAVAQAWSSTVAGMVVGRCIIGAAVGAASFVVPLYIAEVAPAQYRGRLITTNVLFITLGQMVAYVVGWLFSTFASPATGWRWMVGLGALPAAFQGAIVVLMPETPRWLVKVGQSGAAKLVIQKVNGSAGSSRSADALIREIELEVRDEYEAQRMRDHQASGRWRWLGGWQLLMSEGKHRRALAIACLLQGLQQLCGFNSLMYFSATIFTLVGFQSPTLTSLTVAVTNFIFTLIALGLIDRIGRRRILLYSIPFMVMGLLLSAYGFSLLDLGSAASPSPTPEDKDQNSAAPRGAAVMILVSIMIYVASYALGLGNVPWMQSELFPLAVRSLGSGISTATNWTANFVVGLTFLPLMDTLSPPWTFALYAVVCVVGYGLVWRIYPETAGLSLEEATALLDNGWGVR